MPGNYCTSFICTNYLISKISQKSGTNIIPILQMRKLRPRDIKWSAPNCTSKWRSQGSTHNLTVFLLFCFFLKNSLISHLYSMFENEEKRRGQSWLLPSSWQMPWAEKPTLQATRGGLLPRYSFSVLTGLLQVWPHTQYSKISPRCLSNLELLSIPLNRTCK